jgi:vitamin B12 transporter
MDYMHGHFLKKGVLFLCFALTVTAFCPAFAAPSEEEMEILRLFYKEKDLVVSSTRHPKPISQVAENITVVTAKEIEEINAHTVAEVLNRIPGIFINFSEGIGSFGSTSLIYIQGSEERHVLVLVDGVAWNFLNSGAAETNSIPVGIIERIEVIKGPASSAWGSALGGVINIITKPAGAAAGLTGAVRASYGEKNTQDYRAEVSGKAGSAGYYLFAGRQKSDGLLPSRDFDNNSLYGKFHIPLTRDATAGLTMGYSAPKNGLGEYPSGDITSRGNSRTFFATASLDASLTEELGLQVSFRRFQQRFELQNNALGSGIAGAPGALFLDSLYDEETTGGSAKLVWTQGAHTAILGADVDRGSLDQTIQTGPLLQALGVPATSTANPGVERWAVYANDTIAVGRWTVTPGIRYDHNSVSGSFVSPSLGVTCRLDGDTILRASAARGFTMPPLSATSGGGFFLDPNPSLKPERVWSYQAGLESSALKYLWAKVTLFRHDLDDALKRAPFAGAPPVFNDLYINGGSVRRQGIEVETETVPLYNLILRAGFSYVDLNPINDSGSTGIHAWNVGLRYDNRKTFRAQLSGRYVWWNLDPTLRASYDDFIWDFNLSKKIYSQGKSAVEVFFSAHNIFNGSQYTFGDIINPGRWVEAGTRISF